MRSQTTQMSELLTILIPTYNRYARLRRLLRYLASIRTSYRVLVLDSSSEALDSNELSARLAGEHILYLRYEPTLPFMQKVFDGLSHVSSPYAVLWADDDFLVPATFEEGLHLLEQEQGISVVHGRSGLFRIETRHIQWVAPYLQRSIPDETASARLLNHLRGYTVMWYSIHRTEKLRSNVQNILQHSLDLHTWGEIALSALDVIQGKAVALPRLYMVREGHEGMGSVQIQRERGLDPFDWLTDSTFTRQHGSYEQFRDCLVEELLQHEALDLEQAREVVKEGFWWYLMKQMTEKWQFKDGRRHPQSVPQRLRTTLQNVQWLRQTWRKGRAWFPHRPTTMSLDALRQPWSRYHGDFLPIYQAIVESP